MSLQRPLMLIGKTRIYGNNQPHPLINWSDLSKKEQENFDYLDTEEKQDSFLGFRYKNWVYFLGDFEYAPKNSWMELYGFTSGLAQSAFSGILIKFVEDNDDSVLVYTYID